MDGAKVKRLKARRSGYVVTMGGRDGVDGDGGNGGEWGG